MTNDTYTALSACARRRVEHEWDCGETERALLLLITELSLDLGQTWACVPCLNDFAVVLDVHKSTVSRALRAAMRKGYLQILMRRDETLYAIATDTRGPVRDEGQQVDAAAAARARLVAMNKNRLQGQADADGQQRLPGLLPSEEIEAPARAYSAIMEEQTVSNLTAHSGVYAGQAGMPEPRTGAAQLSDLTTPLRPTRAANAADEDEPLEALQARLEAAVKAEEAKGSTDGPRPSFRDLVSQADKLPPVSGGLNPRDVAFARLCMGLSGQALHAMQCLREEFQAAGSVQEADLFRFGSVWRGRCERTTRAVLEAVGAHRAMRKEQGQCADKPGAWIYRMYQQLLGGAGARSG